MPRDSSCMLKAVQARPSRRHRHMPAFDIGSLAAALSLMQWPMHPLLEARFPVQGETHAAYVAYMMQWVSRTAGVMTVPGVSELVFALPHLLYTRDVGALAATFPGWAIILRTELGGRWHALRVFRMRVVGLEAGAGQDEFEAAWQEEVALGELETVSSGAPSSEPPSPGY